MAAGVNVGNLNIKFNADITNLKKGFGEVNKMLKNFEKTSTKFDVKINADTKGLETGVKRAIDTLDTFYKKAENEAGDAGKKAGDEFGDGFEDGLNDRVEKINFSDSLKNMFSGMTKFGKQGMKKVTAPILGAGTAMWKMSANFNDAMATVDTIADTSIVSLEELKEQAIDVSKTFGITAKDIAQTQYGSISAGVDEKSVGDFTAVAAMSSKAGFSDMETAVDGLTTVLNAYNLESKYAISIADQMLVAQNLGKTTFDAMAKSMGGAIPLASALNVSTGEFFASLATLTKNGIQTNKAITGLKAAYSSILNPSTEAAAVAEHLGIEFNAAYIKSVGWSKFLEEIMEKTGGSEVALAKLFGSVEAINSLLVLTGKGANDFNLALKEINNSAGATAEAYNKLLTPQEELKNSINRLKLAFLSWGEAIEPVVEKLTEVINGFAETVANMSDETIQRIMTIAGAFALLFPAIYIVGTLGESIFWVGKVIGGVGELVIGFGKIIKNVFTKDFLVANAGIMLLIGSLAFFVGVLWNAKDESVITAETIGEKFITLGVRIAGVVKLVGGMVHAIVSLVVSGISIVIEKALSKIQDFLNSMQNLADKLGLDWLSGKIGGGVDNIDAAIKKLKDTRTGMTEKTREISDNALYMMDSPMDFYMDKQVKKGKINVEGTIAGNNVTFIGKKDNPFLFDNKGRLTQQAKENIQKQRQRDFKIDVPELDMPNLPDSLELPELELPEFKRDDILDGLNDKLDKKVPKAAKKSKTEVDKLQEALKKLGDEFKNTSDQIRGSIGMFDRFRAKATSSYRLLRNAREREKAFKERENILKNLSQRGLGDEIMAQLYKTSIDQLGDLKGLNRMTQEQLMEWARLQQSANASADRQAIEQVVHINIDAANKDYKEVEKEIYRRLKARGIAIY